MRLGSACFTPLIFCRSVFLVVTVIVENDGHLVGRGLQSVARSSTIKKKDNSVTKESALNDLIFKLKSYLIIKNVF